MMIHFQHTASTYRAVMCPWWLYLLTFLAVSECHQITKPKCPITSQNLTVLLPDSCVYSLLPIPWSQGTNWLLLYFRWPPWVNLIARWSYHICLISLLLSSFVSCIYSQGTKFNIFFLIFHLRWIERVWRVRVSRVITWRQSFKIIVVFEYLFTAFAQ
jgi:hypothetical protein